MCSRCARVCQSQAVAPSPGVLWNKPSNFSGAPAAHPAPASAVPGVSLGQIPGRVEWNRTEEQRRGPAGLPARVSWVLPVCALESLQDTPACKPLRAGRAGRDLGKPPSGLARECAHSGTQWSGVVAHARAGRKPLLRAL